MEASRSSWVAVLVVGLALFEAVRRALITTGNPNLVPSLILLGAAVMPTSFVTFIAQRRLSYSVDLGWVAGVALVGGVVGVVTAGVLEFDTLRRLGPTAEAFTFRLTFPAPDADEAPPPVLDECA